MRLGLLIAVALAVSVAAVAAAAPPGATALCRDGAYSYSKHHSGTCSHHGGVAKWLDGSGSSGSVSTGRTVLLGQRTQTSSCVRSSRPDRACSPGGYYARLTRRVICAPGFRTSTIRNVPQSEKFQVEREYGMAAAYYGYTIEIDHIVPLELGGSNAIANLFPEPGAVPRTTTRRTRSRTARRTRSAPGSCRYALRGKALRGTGRRSTAASSATRRIESG